MTMPARRLTTAPTSERDWGPWFLDGTDLVYEGHYSIDLTTCTDSAQLADWVFQVVAKTWSDHYIVGGLMRALGEILKPQATLCSNGQSLSLRPREIERLAGRFA